jgi:4-amino-4-deoxy-L-arabinose transferase-like glycosyltransferase
MKIKNLLFITIFLISVLTRFIGLDTVSPPLNRDEAAIGYNAYSILKTGKDEHGVSYPFSFKSIGDYKMPAYIYLTTLPVKLFGLNEFSTRFFSAVSGVLAVVCLYFITSIIQIFLKLPYPTKYWPLLTSFLLAINPWHIHYSRIGFEANLNLTLFLFALLFFLKGLSQSKYFIISSLLIVAMQFTYSSSFIFLPLFIPSLLTLFTKQKVKINKSLILSVFIFIVGSSLAFISVSQVSKAKSTITFFQDPTTIDTFNHIRGEWNQKNPFLAKTWYNKYFYLGRTAFQKHLEVFLPGFLVFNKVNHPWHYVPGQGFFYFFDLLFFVIGLSILIYQYRKSKNKKFFLLLILWLLLSPAASSITVDAPHATRSLYLIPIFLLFSSFGISVLLTKIHKKNLLLSGIVFVYLVSFIRFSYLYIYDYPQKYASSLYSGIKPVIKYLQTNPNSKKIVFKDVDSSPYLYVLFYSQVDPNFVQKNSTWKAPDTVGMTNIEQLGNYFFLDNADSLKEPSLLVLQSKQTTPNGFTLEKEFIDKFGNITWQVYKN